MMDEIIWGVLTGFGYSLTGWLKNSDEEDFDLRKLARTLLSCGLVGAFAGYTDAGFNALMTGSLGIAVDSVVGNLFSFVKRRFM